MGSRRTPLRGTRLAVAVLVAAGLLAVPTLAYAATSPHGAYDPTVSTGTDKCAQCHAPHVASLAQGLLSREPTTTAVTQSDLCFDCHGYSGPALSNALASFDDGTFPSGHVVEDATGTVTPDLTNVCTGCHDAHSEIPGLPGELVNGQEVTRTPQPDDPNLRNSWCFACHTPEIDPNWSGLVGCRVMGEEVTWL